MVCSSDFVPLYLCVTKLVHLIFRQRQCGYRTSIISARGLPIHNGAPKGDGVRRRPDVRKTMCSGASDGDECTGAQKRGNARRRGSNTVPRVRGRPNSGETPGDGSKAVIRVRLRLKVMEPEVGSDPLMPNGGHRATHWDHAVDGGLQRLFRTSPLRSGMV